MPPKSSPAKSKAKPKSVVSAVTKSSSDSTTSFPVFTPNDSIVAYLASQGKITTQVKTHIANADRSWAEGFKGLPLHTYPTDSSEFPVPPSLNSNQEKIWRSMFRKGQEALNGDRAMGADDAMEMICYKKSNLSDPDTAVVADHVAVFLKWFRAQFDDAMGFMNDIGGNESEEEEEGKS